MIQINKNADDETLNKVWKKINWAEVEETLGNLQRDIAFAAYKHDKSAIAEAQKRLVRSLPARLLAVRHVSDSIAKPGIDNIKWETGADKMRAALSLTSKGYIAQPMRYIIIRPKGSAKERHIQIPTFYDRAMQTLYAYSLDPVSESYADKKSFAYRKGRSMQDVHTHIINALENKNPPKYLVKTDVKACYGSISHDWLIENIPMEKAVLKQFLKAGHVFCGELFPPDDFGISLGSSLSPILANMTLDGAAQTIYERLNGKGYEGIDYVDGNFIRFADDILVTARTRESAEKIVRTLDAFFAVRGLKLSPEKTRIISLEYGFEFLSRKYEIFDKMVYSMPSESAVVKMENSLKELISTWHGGQKALIEKINKKLIGWASYHKVSEATEAFKRIDTVVKTLLLELCERVNPKISREKIIAKYFYLERDGEYVYALENKPDVKIHRLSDVVLVNHKPASIRMNPYVDTDYFENINDERAIRNVTGKHKTIWERQKGKCFYCGKKILWDEEKDLVTIDPLLPETPRNSAYVHEYCKLGQAEFYESDFDVESRFDFHELLRRMNEGKQAQKKCKYRSLTDYFRERTESVFTLTFEKIEEIIGCQLCNCAKKNRHYWYVRGETRISFSWLSNGYEIRNINFEAKRVVFERNELKGEAVNIPPIFFKRIPPDAKAEVEIMLDYVKKKFGL